MYSYKIDSKTNVQANEKTNLSNDLLGGLNAIEDAYSLKDPDDLKDLGLEKKDTIEANKDKIKQDALSALEDYKNAATGNIDSNFEVKQGQVDQKMDILNENNIKDKNELDEGFAKLKDKSYNAMVGNGLKFSSIIVNNQKAFDEEKLKEFAKLDGELTSNLSLLNSQKNILAEEKNTALKNFDITYAVKLSDKIDGINKEINTQNDRIAKYNADIEKKEKDYDESQKKNIISHNKDLLSRYPAMSLDKVKGQAKYDYALKQILGHGNVKESLQEVENNSEYKKQLGSRYNDLVNELRKWK